MTKKKVSKRRANRPRRQCAKCPWKKTTDPNEIPNGYCAQKHSALDGTIAEPGAIDQIGSPVHMMACHETPVGKELPCVGWLINQLGRGNNIALRLAVHCGRVDANVQAVGEQHETFADTLPRDS